MTNVVGAGKYSEKTNLMSAARLLSNPDRAVSPKRESLDFAGHLFIDFETRSEIDLKAAGAVEYARHPSTEILVAAVKQGEGHAWELQDFKRHPPIRFNRVVAHNVGFEAAIWKHIMTPRYGWPKVPFSAWECSAARARAAGLPGKLEDAALALGLLEQKDKEGSALMKKVSKPRPHWKKTGKGPKWFWDNKIKERIESYCIQDVETMVELFRKTPPLMPEERETFQLDLLINRRGFPIDRKLVEAAIRLLSVADAEANEELRDLTSGDVGTPNQTGRIREWLGTWHNIDIPNMQEPMVAKALEGDLPPEARRVLEIRAEFARASVKKYQAMVARTMTSDRVRDTLIFCGAHTGRWTARKVQPHNYIRPMFDRATVENIAIPYITKGDEAGLRDLFGDIVTPISSSLRGSICTALGRRLIAADYSAIEARALAWYVEEKAALDAYYRNEDLYRVMAGLIFGKPTLKVPEKGDERDLGKRAVLGLGYQMAAAKFKATCKKYGQIISMSLASRAVEIYRSKYQAVKKSWKVSERAAISAVRRPGRRFPLYRGAYFLREGRFLSLYLPSGRAIRYVDPSIVTNRFGNDAVAYWGVHPKTKKWVQLDSYGGKWIENQIQAIARDIMAHGMKRAERKGYKIILTVHDEIVSEVEDGFGSVEEFESLICELPSWAKGLPIAAEGWTGRRFRK